MMPADKSRYPTDPIRAALSPFARWAALVLAQMAGRDAPMRDGDIVLKLDDCALTVGDLRRAVAALEEE